ncbi:mechanosensitive ion channel family protein [Saliphagus sp. GCM10025317]
MVDAFTGLEWLENTFHTQIQKGVATAVVTGLFLLVLIFHRRLQSWISDRSRALYADIVATILLFGTGGLALYVAVGVWGATEELSTVLSRFDPDGTFLPRMTASFVMVVLTYIVWRFVRRLLHDVVASSTTVTKHQEEVSNRVIQVFIWSVTLVIVLSIWIDDLSGLLVGAGFLGIVVGMAARQTLGALLAGFVLMFSRSFEIGHWVEIDGREGTVTNISIFNTQIQSFDGEYIVVPNDVVTTSIVTNRSKKGRLRIEVEVGVDYSVDVDQAATLARDALEPIEEVMDVPEPMVVTKHFGESSVVLGVRFWIDRPSARRRWTARTKAISAIKTQFEEADVKIPYPQRELSGREETDGFRMRVNEPVNETTARGTASSRPSEDD